MLNAQIERSTSFFTRWIDSRREQPSSAVVIADGSPSRVFPCQGDVLPPAIAQSCVWLIVLERWSFPIFVRSWI